MVLDRGRSGLRLGVICLFACLLWVVPATSRAEIIFSDDFESDFGNFVQVAGDDFDWSRNSGRTPSTGTGPEIDHTLGTSAGFYFYTEASSPNNPNLTTLIETACLDLSANSSLTWSFWYHMFGSGMGSLFAEVAPGRGSTWDTLSTLIGSNQTATTEPLVQVTMNLDSYAGTSIKLRYRGVTGSSFSSDIAIDDVTLLGGVCGDSQVDANETCDDGNTAAAVLVVALLLAWPSSAQVAASFHSNAQESRNVDGTAFSELTADDAKDIAVDRTTHLVTTFDQISTTGTWGKRWV